jgi:exopolyphosphatase/guanosine-5'-triphosphate,3'-diphosphate pyrophosphatase
VDARPHLSGGADARPRSGPPVAIIDIGSNSVRLVIYEGSGRAPTPLYNEKLMCGLGRGVAKSRRLPDDAVVRALEALARFRVICRTAQVGKVWVLATAAARDAENGPDFLSAAELACGHPIELLTGEREAALSAAGIISGFHEPDGIVGDLGGGSLELADVAGATAGRGATFPLGGLVLKDLADGSTKAARAIAREALERSSHLAALEGRTFYAVGGTWRALARLQMAERDYPLRVMHGYEFDLERGGFLRQVERTSPRR